MSNPKEGPIKASYLLIDFTPEDRKFVENAAAELGLPVREWVKQAVLRAAERVTANPYLDNEMRRRTQPGADQQRLC